MAAVSKFVALFHKCESLADVEGVCGKFCRAYGFDYYHYGLRIPLSLNRPQYLVLSSYPASWEQRYNDQNYQVCDPIVLQCANSVTPIFWDQILEQGSVLGDVSIIREAYEHGLAGSVSIPIHGVWGEFAMFSVVPNGQAIADDVLAVVTLFSKYVHEAVLRLSACIQAPAALSPRERECLMWAADGKTSWETAKILNISERTVLFHFKNIMLKLGVGNKTQAVAKSILNRHITAA